MASDKTAPKVKWSDVPNARLRAGDKLTVGDVHPARYKLSARAKERGHTEGSTGFRGRCSDDDGNEYQVTAVLIRPDISED
jgi:hypothetical protein